MIRQKRFNNFLFINAVILFSIFKTLCATLPNGELFLSAGNEYQKGYVENALAKFQEITIKGSQVHYNIGICYHALKNYSYALLHWRRAQKFASYDLWALCEKNIYSIKNNSRENRLSYLLKFIYANFVKRFGLLSLQLLFLLCWFLLLIIGYRLYTMRKWWMIVFISIIFMFSSLLLIYDWYCKKNLHAIIVPSQVIIYAGPDITYHQVGQLQGLNEIIVEEQKDTWYKIHYLDNHGWIQKGTCEIV